MGSGFISKSPVQPHKHPEGHFAVPQKQAGFQKSQFTRTKQELNCFYPTEFQTP